MLQFILSALLLISICYFCDPSMILGAIPFGLATSIIAGGEIMSAYHRMRLRRTHFAGSRFCIECCIHLLVVASYIEIVQFRFDTLWSIATAYYGCVVICQIISCIVTPVDPEFKRKVDRSLWLDAVQKDPLTSNVTDEDFHKDRIKEDWHGT